MGCHLFESGVSNSSSSPSRLGLFPLLLSIGASLPRGCQLQASDPTFVDDLIRLAASPSASPSTSSASKSADAASTDALPTGAAKLVAAIVNKSDNDAALTVLLDKISVSVEGEKTDNQKDGGGGGKDVCLNGVRLWIWVTKALVIRSHRLSKQFTLKLVSWLRIGRGGGDDGGASPEQVASLISSEGFVTILADSDEVFSVRQHAVTRKMFKQRFFLQTIPALINKKESSVKEKEEEEDEGKEEKRKSEQHRLNALASMLPHLPQQALLSELPSILPLLVKVSQDP